MRDLAQDNQRIVVSTDGTAGPYIMASNMMVAEVVVQLNKLKVGHWVEESGIQLDGQTHVMIINIPGADEAKVKLIQDALDSIE